LALRQKEIEEAIAQALIETEATAELTRKKAVGALASSVPNVNPIIGTLTKLITLVSKQNILFNSKIKKNINLLDRLDVEDLISKLNKTISNLTNINFSYIIVSIENGYEMLEQLFTALNKLSFDVSNSVYNYTSSLRGGTRYINDHLQHFKFRGMSSNPHPYYYMM
jgi:PPE-repeat protein